MSTGLHNEPICQNSASGTTMTASIDVTGKYAYFDQFSTDLLASLYQLLFPKEH